MSSARVASRRRRCRAKPYRTSWGATLTPAEDASAWGTLYSRPSGSRASPRARSILAQYQEPGVQGALGIQERQAHPATPAAASAGVSVRVSTIGSPVNACLLRRSSDVAQVLRCPTLLPPGNERHSLGKKDYAYLAPGMARSVRVTTDPAYYDAYADSVELWSPRNPLFPTVEDTDAEQALTPEAFRAVIGEEKLAQGT